MWAFGALFGLTVLQAWALSIAALHLGRHFRILDYPDKERKLHARATPRTGGVAVCVALVLAIGEFTLAGGMVHLNAPASRWTVCLVVSTVLLCAVGLWDDKGGMRARTKFLWQFAAIGPFVCWGRTAATADLFGWHLDLAWLTIPLVLFWLVSCTNFVNLMDGLDGLAATVGLIISVTVAAIAWLNQLTEVFVPAVCLAGALWGFLALNWPPAKIFLGDSGSLPLGFLVGALSLEAAAKKAAGLTLAVPVVLLSIPMFDTSMAILRRKLNGRRIGQGDRAHIHHCLRDRGLTPTPTPLALAGMCLATATAAVLATVLNNDLIAVGICLAVLAVLISRRLFGFNETVLLVRHVQALGAFLRSVPRVLRMKFVVVRLEAAVAAGQLDLWNKLIKRAKRLDGLKIDFTCEHLPSGRKMTTLIWNSALDAEAIAAADSPVWQFHYSVPRGGGVETRIRASGRAPRAAGMAWLHEFSEMLVALCDNWPVEEQATLVLDDAPADPSPAAEGPKILTVPWGSSRAGKAGVEWPSR